MARIDRVCGAGLSAKDLRLAVLAEVGPVVPFQGFVFMLTDPVTAVGVSPIADIPGLDRALLPDLIRMRYLTTVNRWDNLQAGSKPAAALLAATSGHPEESAIWAGFQRDLGVADVASVTFGDRHGIWAMLDLWRMDGSFDRGHLQFLAALCPPVTRALRSALARTFVEGEQNPSPAGPAVVVLDQGLRIRGSTPAAEQAIVGLNPPDGDAQAVPAAAFNVGAALIAEEQGVPVGPAWARVHLGGSGWVTVRADRIGSEGDPRDRDIAVSIEPSTSAGRADMFARVHGLSRRETEVLHSLLAGSSSSDIARDLVVSEHTANDHVRSILRKVDAPTRQVLLARILGSG